MDPLTMGALALQGATGVFKTVSGLFGGNKTEAEIKRAQQNRAKYKVNQAVKDNQALTEAKASQGLSDSSLQQYSQGASRGLTASLSAMLLGGTAMNNIADTYAAYQGANGKMAIVDNEMQARNVNNLIIQNRELDGALDKEWQINEDAPWKDRMKALNAKKDEQNKRMWSGIDTIGATAANFAAANTYQKEGDNVYGAKTVAGQITPATNATSSTGAKTAEEAIATVENIIAQKPQEAQGAKKLTAIERVIQMYPGLMMGGYGKGYFETGGNN